VRTAPIRPHPSDEPARRQRGVALVVSLILLLVITLIGITAIRLTTVQQKITANFYDRESAFQSTEATLMQAAQTLGTTSVVIARNCGQGGVSCLANPFADSTLPSGGIVTTASGQQYVIENMGQYPDPTTDTGFNQTANAAQYGAQGVSGVLHTFYRITARSGDPSQIGDRAVVTLQAMYRQ
jgi:type IV pilus assembly protein PilX